MEAQDQVHEARLAGLRRRLVARARRDRLTPDDIEDMVQEALLKVLRERTRPGQPVIEIRAYTALRDARAEFFRQRSRDTRRLVSTTPDGQGEVVLPEHLEEGRPLDVVDTCEVVRQLAGSDVLVFAWLKSVGLTEADVAALMGWPASRAAAARIKLSRKRSLLVKAMRGEFLEEEER